MVSKLSEIWSGLFIPDPDPRSGFWLFTHPGSRESKSHRIPDPDPQHCFFRFADNLVSILAWGRGCAAWGRASRSQGRAARWRRLRPHSPGRWRPRSGRAGPPRGARTWCRAAGTQPPLCRCRQAGCGPVGCTAARQCRCSPPHTSLSSPAALLL